MGNFKQSFSSNCFKFTFSLDNASYVICKNLWVCTIHGYIHAKVWKYLLLLFGNLFFLIGQTVSAFSAHRFGIKEGCVAVAVSCVLRPSYNLYCVRHTMCTTAVAQQLLYKKGGNIPPYSGSPNDDRTVG